MEALRTGDWLTRERVTRIAAISAAFGVAMLAFLWLAGHGTLDYFGKPIGSDFTAFWSAGHIADSSNPARAWDQALLNEAVRAKHGADYGTAWLYPPVFLFAAAPLGALPYLPALLLWQILSLSLAAAVLKAILKDWRDTLIALASPLSPLVLANGQNSFLTAALLGLGLVLAQRRPATAGALLGGLVYKPQLGLVIAPYLLLTRNWRALGAAIAVAVALVAVSVSLWGIESWSAFASSLAYGRVYMEQGAVGFFKSVSLFAMAREWGSSVDLAYVIQMVGVLGGAWILWTIRKTEEFVRAAGVCLAAAFSTPYLLDYDMTVVGIGAAFLYAEAMRTRFAPYERSILAFVWIAPWISRPAAQYTTIPLGVIAMLLLAWMSYRRVRHGIAIPPFTCSVCPVT